LKALGAILAVSVFVDLVFFTGFIASDDVLYVTAARQLVETGTLWPDLAAHEVRLLVIGWCALAGFWVRHDVQTIAASFVLFHQALTVLTFVLARQVQGLGAALLAALLTASFPLLVVYSTTILPDIPMAVCFVAALLAFRSGLTLAPGAPRARLAFAVGGACVGLAYLAKESGLIPVPFFVALTLFGTGSTLEPARRLGRAGARSGWLLAGLAFVLGLEALALRALTGAWSFRLRAFFEGGGGGAPSLAGLGERALGLERAVTDHLPGAAVAMVALVAVAAVIHAAKRPGLGAILSFPAWYIAYYTWGSASLTSYYSPSLQARYFIPCLPFLIIALSALLSTGSARAAEYVRRRHPGMEWELRVLAAAAVISAVAVQVALADRHAGRVYGAPLVTQSLRALRSRSLAPDTPVVMSEVLGAQLFPLFQDRPERLLFSHEVGSDQLEEWRRRGGFHFMDLHPTSGLRRADRNPLLGWRHGLPTSPRCAEGLVESLLSGPPFERGWAVRPEGRFDRMGSRSAEIRALLGDADALSALQYRPDRGVIVYRVAAADDDVRYPLPALDPGDAPGVANGTFTQWSETGPLGWQIRDASASPARGPAGAEGVRIGAGRLSYLWQSLDIKRSLRGRRLVLGAKARSEQPGAARLWIKVAIGADWEEAFGDPHPGDGHWRRLEAVVTVPPGFEGGEARIVLLHSGRPGPSEFADVEVSVR
jgi:4-amino-4-deoxy-L-arabinose transferase-like glycosyltransferase